jgi:hypothetical protein
MLVQAFLWSATQLSHLPPPLPAGNFPVLAAPKMPPGESVKMNHLLGHEVKALLLSVTELAFQVIHVA